MDNNQSDKELTPIQGCECGCNKNIKEENNE